MKKWVRNLFSARRWHAFIFSPLWLGLPVAAALAFGVVWVMYSLSSDPEVAARCVRGALISGGCTAFAWILGMFAASGPDIPDKEENAAADKSAASTTDSGPWRGWFALAGWCLLFLLLISIPDIRMVVGEGRPVIVGVVGVVTKLFAVVAVVIPVYVTMHRRQ